MDIETALFIIVGLISIMSAALMLIDENVVHSALFLVVNFACIAFFYLMLDAAFLAMVQIAVYAGAIMVLFLFVIMLLGAEKVTSDETRQLRALGWIAALLAAAFAIVIYVAIDQGAINEKATPASQPLVRVVHAVPGASPVNVMVDEELIADGLDYREFSDYVAVDTGEHSLSITTEDGTPILSAQVDAAADSVTTLVAYVNNGAVTLASVAENLSLIEDKDTGRLVVFNAYPEQEALNLVKIGSDYKFADADEAAAAKVYAGDLAFGTASDVLSLDAGQLRAVFALTNEAKANEIVLPLRDFEITENASTMIVLGLDSVAEEAGLPYITTSVSETDYQYGSPQGVGEVLFTKYVLPIEMVAVLLLAAMVGAIVITQRAELRPKPGRPTRRRVSRPLTSVIAQQTGHSVEDAGDLDIVDQPAGD